MLNSTPCPLHPCPVPAFFCGVVEYLEHFHRILYSIYSILSADDLHASVPPAAGGSLSVLYSVAQHLPASLLCTTPHHTTPPNHNRYLYLNIPQRVQYILLETQARLYRNSSTPAVFFDRLRKKKMLAPSNDRGSIAISWRSARLRCLASSLDCIHLAAAEM